jgi:hypothetical protein
MTTFEWYGWERSQPISGEGGVPVFSKKLSLAIVAFAGLFWASEAFAICQTCISVTITNPNTGEEKQTVTCYPSPCTSLHGGTVLRMPFAPNLSVREGSACSVKLKSSLATTTSHGSVHGHTCVLSSR